MDCGSVIHPLMAQTALEREHPPSNRQGIVAGFCSNTNNALPEAVASSIDPAQVARNRDRVPLWTPPGARPEVDPKPPPPRPPLPCGHCIAVELCNEVPEIPLRLPSTHALLIRAANPN